MIKYGNCYKDENLKVTKIWKMLQCQGGFGGMGLGKLIGIRGVGVTVVEVGLEEMELVRRGSSQGNQKSLGVGVKGVWVVGSGWDRACRRGWSVGQGLGSGSWGQGGLGSGKLELEKLGSGELGSKELGSGGLMTFPTSLTPTPPTPTPRPQPPDANFPDSNFPNPNPPEP